MSFDVVGLYPHIPHEEGLELLKYFLGKPEDQSVTSENLCRLLKIILKHYYFKLESDLYHQIRPKLCQHLYGRVGGQFIQTIKV